MYLVGITENVETKNWSINMRMYLEGLTVNPETNNWSIKHENVSCKDY